MHEFSTERRIEFVDTDMGGIVHFSRFFVFMETAEHQLLEALGTSVDSEADGRRIGWPRVAASCDYLSPARFGEVLRIDLRVLRKGARSMTYGFRFSVDERAIAEGQMTSVCCELEPGRDVRAVPIPAIVADQLEEAPD
jgi:4-hydroxybenzoyl-CoA thioesterase/acyl-CoA thioester hydrolase